MAHPYDMLFFFLFFLFIKDWAGCAVLWADATPIKLPTFNM